MAIANNVVPYTLYPIAQRYVDPGAAAILAATAPLFSLVTGHFAIVGLSLSLPSPPTDAFLILSLL